MSKHTPGPWKATMDPSPEGVYHIRSDDGRVALVYTREDAIAIRAMPDLLKALRTLSDIAVDSVEYSDWPELQKAIKKAERAIAKATGEQP